MVTHGQCVWPCVASEDGGRCVRLRYAMGMYSREWETQTAQGESHVATRTAHTRTSTAFVAVAPTRT